MIIYLAHPVGQEPQRSVNLVNVQKWFLWLFKHTDWTINVPWFIYVSNLDESNRDRCVRDDLTIADTCHGICLTGGKITHGMQQELGVVMMNKGRVIDLTSLGYEPPSTPEETEKALVLIQEMMQ